MRPNAIEANLARSIDAFDDRDGAEDHDDDGDHHDGRGDGGSDDGSR